MSTFEFLLALAGIIFGATGFWTLISTIIQNRNKRQNAMMKLTLGLAHEKIIELGLSYIERGSITKDEYEDLIKYLYKPYKDLDGNGTAEKIIDMVRQLPIK